MGCIALILGRVPWVQPWGRAGGAAPGLPRNALSARSYSGINVLILWGAVIEHGYPSQGWLTFKQALSAGGSVRKGERGTTVVYADRFVPGDEKARAAQAGGDAKAVLFPKRFTVFNVAQCDDLPAAREELVAEMGSAFLCVSLGIVPTVRHADYLASWLDVLRDDGRAIFRAASAASKAADWLLARYHAADIPSASGIPDAPELPRA
ncbi:ArdC-like ssDNA-binding domain-containing protein [Sphingomonas sp. S1-29]|nr:ArdC-like ssDNA-binding domain-containing protein [Sphingomonas sp. S1-29]UZK70950.1 ArdC-like ssDNA-binding domain-containing protein [Sphingomonas sp. S1-29]